MHKRPPFTDRLTKRVAAGHITEAEKVLALFIAGQCGVELLVRDMGAHWAASFEWCAVHHAKGDTPDEAMRAFGRQLHADGFINADTLIGFEAVNVPAVLIATQLECQQ